MLINRYEPFNLFLDIEKRFENAVSNFGNIKANSFENEKEFVLKLEIPGVKKEDIDISLDKRNLTISAKKENSIEDKKYLSEIYYGEVKRSFSLPDNASEKITADLTDGVLTINIKKIEKEESIKKIELK